MTQPPAADRRIWLACAPALSRLPEVGDAVYYLPGGHAAQCHGALPAHLRDRLLCKVAGVTLDATAFDDVYARIALRPERGRALVAGGDELEPDQSARSANLQRDDLVLIYPKVLTADEACRLDVEEGWKRGRKGAFHVPKECARRIFPVLDSARYGPCQTLHMTDLAGQVFSFGHTLSGLVGGRRQDLLTSGWNDYVAAKKVLGKDVVLFVRAPGRLVIAAQRAAPPGTLINMEEVEVASRLAAEGSAFTVTWCPRLGAEFIVPRDELEACLRFKWAPEMRVSVRTGTVRAGGVVAAQGLHVFKLMGGTVKSVRDSSWHKLEVQWDPDTDTDRREDWRPSSSNTTVASSAPSSATATATASVSKGKGRASSYVTTATSAAYSKGDDRPSSSTTTPQASDGATSSRTAPVRLFGATIAQ